MSPDASSKPEARDFEWAREWLCAEEQMAKANWPMGRPSEIYVASLASLLQRVRAEERKRCARIAREIAAYYATREPVGISDDHGYALVADEVGDKIEEAE